MNDSKARDVIRQRLLDKAGLSDNHRFNIEALRGSEWSPGFEELMRNRLVMGAMRYGKLHAPGKPRYDRVASCFKRLEAYKETGNKELLVDIANLVLLEFEENYHPKAHFRSVDSAEFHVAVIE